MEHFRTDLRRHKTEPKNYIALNRKKACAKNPPNLPPVPEATRHSIQDRTMLRRQEKEREGPLTGEVKRSIEQLASFINSGDLERIIQLAKEIKETPEGREQPDHLKHSKVHSQYKEDTQPQQVQAYKAVEPSCVPGLDVYRGNIPISIPKSESPITTAIPTQTSCPEPYFGRGQGLRQLLELDNTGPAALHSVRQPQSTDTNATARKAKVEETEYYPWGKPGAGAPLTKGHERTSLAIHHKPIQVNSQKKSSNDSTLVRNCDTLRPEEERKRKASQYMLDLRAQVNEKERLKREEQERQAEFDRMVNDRIARDQDRLLREAECDRERLNQKQQDAHRRFEYLQAKIEEQNRLAIAEKERKKKHHHTNLSRKNQNNSPSNLQPLNPSIIHSPHHKQKSFKTKSAQQQANNKQGQIRNPPPSQIHLIKPINLNANKKSYSLPTTRQVESETGKNYLNVSSEFLDNSVDMSRPSSAATTIDRVLSVHDTHTQLSTQPNSTALLQQQVYGEQESIDVIRQLQKLKQGLHVKQQELHSNYF